MPSRKLQVFDSYQYGPRSKLVPGDKFRVAGGPVYVTNDGTTLPMYERGVFVFRRYCERGAAKWIEAHRSDGGGHVVLWVGNSIRSNLIPNFYRRPYRITGKVRESRPKRRTRFQSSPSKNKNNPPGDNA